MSEITLKNRFAALQEPTMSGQDATGVGKRKARPTTADRCLQEDELVRLHLPPERRGLLAQICKKFHSLV